MADIIGNINEDHLVQKSYPILYAMQSVKFSLGEIKILDTYLSRIDSHEDFNDVVEFSMSEYLELMGLNAYHSDVVKKFSRGLLDKVVEVPISSIPADSGIEYDDDLAVDGYYLFPLFSRCRVAKSESGKVTVRLKCSEEAKKLFFNIEKLRYIKYALGNIIHLVHSASCYMYMYILTQAYKGSWTVNIDELKVKWLKLDSNKYRQYKYFNRDVLSIVHQEINSKTDVRYDYEPIKVNRQIVAVKFTFISREKRSKSKAIPSPEATRSPSETKTIALSKSNEPTIVMEEQSSILSSSNEISEIKDDEDIVIPYVDTNIPIDAMIRKICVYDKFDSEGIYKISSALRAKRNNDKDKEENDDITTDEIDNSVEQDYLRYCYSKLIRAKNGEQKISNVASYLVSIINHCNNIPYDPKGPDGEKKYTPEFEEFWNLYPRKGKGEKLSAYRQWILRLREGISANILIETAREYATDCKLNHREEIYISLPKNFLKSEKNKASYLKMLIDEQDKQEELARKEAENKRLQKKYEEEMERKFGDILSSSSSESERPMTKEEEEAADRGIQRALCDQMGIDYWPDIIDDPSQISKVKQQKMQAQKDNLNECWAYWTNNRSEKEQWTEFEDREEYQRMREEISKHTKKDIMNAIDDALRNSAHKIRFDLIGLAF